MFKLYYAAAIDTCVEQAFKEIEEYKQIFSKFPEIEVYGAGFKESPILDEKSTHDKKCVVTAYDLRKIREVDILFVNTDLKTYCAGTMVELDYAKRLGIYVIMLCPEKPKNIFLTSLVDKIIYSKEELEEFLKEITT